MSKRSSGVSAALLTVLLAIGASSLLGCGDPSDGKCGEQCKSCDKDSDCCGELVCKTNGWDSDKHCEPVTYQDEQLCAEAERPTGDNAPCDNPGLRCWYNQTDGASCHCNGWIVIAD